MKKISIFLFCVFFLFCGIAGELKAEKLPTISSEVEVSKYVSATECYVLFLVEVTGENMQDAKAKIDLKLNNFTQMTQKDFPDVKSDVISVNIGTKDFSSFRSAENPFTPNIAKVLIFELPPDEDMAIKLLDSGIKSGLVPFCGISRDGTFGAVFYGLKNVDAEIDKLYPEAVQKLQRQAKKLANELGREIVKMDDISRFTPRENPYEIRFKDMKVILPSEFCASDKSKIKVSLSLRSNFIVTEEESAK